MSMVANTLDRDSTAIGRLLADFSFEITPSEAVRIAIRPDAINEDTQVYIPFLPKNRFADCLEPAERLLRMGLTPVPHIAARRLRNEAEFTDVLAALNKLGVHRVLVIAGDKSAPSGPYSSSIDVLKPGVLEEQGITHISIAGHPEGSPDISDDAVAEALAWKNDYAERSTAELRIVTQFSFDADTVINWEQAIRKSGNRLPISIGLAAPASIGTLIKYAKLCGVRASGSQFLKRGGALMSLASEGAPDGMIEELARAKEADPDSLIDSVHFYTFGGTQRALQWVTGYRDGNS